MFVSALGHGGFGSVYLAWLHGQKGWKRKVAVKVMNAGVEGADVRARQWDEARLLGLLAHENIVQVVDVTEIDGRPAALMEYVEGIDLARIAKAEAAAGRALPTRVVVQLGTAVCAALQAAWSAKNPETGQPLRVIHRDLKPANLLLTPHGGVKVLDFGIARGDFNREAVTRSAAYGTPRFMAPEQWTGEDIGPGTDIYALGVTMWELVHGQPWDRPPLVSGRFDEGVRERNQTGYGPLGALLSKMLSLKISDRPSAAEVQNLLEAMEPGGEPLRRFAARVVPPLLEGVETPSDVPLPGRMSLQGLGDSRTMAEPMPEEPPATLQFPPTGPARKLRAGPIIALVAVATFVTLILGVALTLTMFTQPWAEVPATEVADAAPPEPATETPSEPAASATQAASSGTDAPATTAATAASPVEAPSPEPSKDTRSAKDSKEKATKATKESPAPTESPTQSAPAAAPTVEAVRVAPVPTAAETPAPVPKKVFLTIDSAPRGATVSVGGISRGQTPVTIEVSEGSHAVQLRSEAGSFTGTATTRGPRTAWRFDFTTQAWQRVVQ